MKRRIETKVSRLAGLKLLSWIEETHDKTGGDVMGGSKKTDAFNPVTANIRFSEGS